MTGALSSWGESLEIAVCEVVSLAMRPRTAYIIQLHKNVNEMLPLILDMNLLFSSATRQIWRRIVDGARIGLKTDNLRSDVTTISTLMIIVIRCIPEAFFPPIAAPSPRLLSICKQPGS